MEKDVLRFVSMLFSYLKRGDEQKKCARFFKICKYSFLIFGKWNKQKNCARYFEVCKYAF